MDEIERTAKRYLDSLGEPPLPDGLWQRLEGARRRRMRMRAGAVTASLAAAALALALVLPGIGDGEHPLPAVADQADVVPGQPGPVAEGEAMRTVQSIDRALQAAYDRNAGDDEIEPLWHARQAWVQAAAPAARTDNG